MDRSNHSSTHRSWKMWPQGVMTVGIAGSSASGFPKRQIAQVQPWGATTEKSGDPWSDPWSALRRLCSIIRLKIRINPIVNITAPISLVTPSLADCVDGTTISRGVGLWILQNRP